MNRANLRTVLRRRLNETAADNWTDNDLDGLLIEGLRRMQTLIQRVNPEAFLTFCVTDLVMDQSFYLKPIGFQYEVRVETKGDATVGTRYARIERGDLADVMDAATAAQIGAGNLPARDGSYVSTTRQYAHYGKEFFIGPAPSANVTGGLKVHFVPSLSMAEDTDVPQLALPLHVGIVLYAHLYAIGETGEGRDAILSDLKEILADIPTYYRKTGGKPEALQPQIDKGY